MKTLRNLLAAGIIPFFCCAIGNAQLIYSNAFNGLTVDINGTAPTLATNLAGGMSSAVWNSVSDNGTTYLDENGTVGIGENSVLLPFTAESGYIYTLTASVTVPAMSSGKWITMGFSAYSPAINSALADPRFGSSYVLGNPWTYLTEGSGGDFFFPTRTTTIANAQDMPSPGTYTVQLLLNTTGTNWTASEFVNGSQIGTNYIYTNNLEIGAIGIGQTTLSLSSGITWNYLTLAATGSGPLTNTVNTTVSFSPANVGMPLNPAFDGMSYEKLSLTNNNYFNSTNLPLLKLFSLIGTPAILRVAGGTVDTTGWNAISNTVPIIASEVDTFSGFIKALPTNWSVIYGINLLSNTPANAAAEAAYAANDLGSRLYGFEIGNEPEYGFSTYSAYLARWRSLAAAITNNVPGWAITNGGNGWVFADTDAGQGQLSAYTDPFAINESGIVSLLTQHYYRAAGGVTSDTVPLLLQPDSFLVQLSTNIAVAAAGHCPLGARITETGSYSEGGVQGASDVYGAALWALDFMFTAAVDGCQGVNFHGGGQSPYSPIVDNGTVVQRAGPEFYGLKLFSFLPQGNVIPATVTSLSSNNFTAYGVRQANGAISALLNNKNSSNTVVVSVNLGSYVNGAQLIALTGQSYYTTSYTLGGATIFPTGSWAGGVQATLPATNGQLSVSVPPMSAFLLNPVIVPTNIVISVTGNQLNLNWPTNYTGWLLQSNSVGVATTNWYSVPGSSSTNHVQVMIQPGQLNVFYRLLLP